MERPIVNPSNPYVGPLRIFPGTLVKVSGQAKPNATRFAINFQTGPSLNPRDDLALHLSPCFTPPRIIRNSLTNGVWGLEESWGNGTILSPHAPFEIMILAEPDKFKIAINGQHYCEFVHRIAYQAISYLTVDGDVDIHRIAISSQDSYDSRQPGAPMPSVPSYSAPYPPNPGMGMPMPPMYPNLAPVTNPPGPYPSATSMPAGPTPMPASYSSGFPQTGHHLPPTGTGGPYYPPPPTGGPTPTPNYYQGGYQQPQAPQPGHSSTSTPFGNLPIGGKALGTIAGLGLGAAAGAAALSALNPIKHVKKLMKPHKMFKQPKLGGWSSSSSNSSISSRSSFSSNSS